MSMYAPVIGEPPRLVPTHGRFTPSVTTIESPTETNEILATLPVIVMPPGVTSV
jgi:hypothetical protein